MTPYFGLPMTPESVAIKAVKGRHAFVSFAHPDQLGIAVDVCKSFAIDNGAFSAWMAGNPITDWTDFFEWAEEISYLPHCDFIVIPDVIDGDLNAQTALVGRFLQRFGNRGMQVGAPVFHLHEPLHHARYLARTWTRVCIGSSGEYAEIGTAKWWQRMSAVMDAMCDEKGRPLCKIHGLRMLDPDVFTRFPFASADSTNVARNIGIDSRWRGTYSPATKEARALVIIDRTEAFQGATRWEKQMQQMELVA